MKPLKDRSETQLLFDDLAIKFAEAAAEEQYDQWVIKHPHATHDPVRKTSQKEKFFDENFAQFRDIFDQHLKDSEAGAKVIQEALKQLPPLQQEEIVGELLEVMDKIATSQPLQSDPTPWKALGLSHKTLTWMMTEVDSKIKEQHYHEALSICYILLQLDPLNPYLWLNYGYCLQQEKRWEKAIEAFAMCIMIDESLLHARYYAAMCYLELGLPKDAALEMEELKKGLTTPELVKLWEPLIHTVVQSPKEAS